MVVSLFFAFLERRIVMSIKKISALLLAVLLIASTAVFSVSAVSQSYSYIYNYALKVKMDISSTGGKKPYAYYYYCLLYTSPSPRDAHESRMPSSA